MAVYTTPMGNQVRLKLKGSIVESGSEPNWSYSGAAAGVPNTQRTGIFPGIIPANQNGSIAIKVTTPGEISLALHKSTTQPADGTDFDFRSTIRSSTQTYQPVKPGQATDTPELPKVDDIMQMRRQDTTIVAELSRDNGATWITLVTWTGVPFTQELTGMLFLGVGTVIGGLYSKGLRLGAAFDTFEGLAAGTSLTNRLWKSGDFSWPTDALVRLKANGAGYVTRDLTLNDTRTVARLTMREGDLGLAVAFKHTNTDETLTPILRIGCDSSGAAGMQVKLVGGRMLALEQGYGLDGGSNSVPAVLMLDQEYLFEASLSDDASGKVYNFRLMRAPGGARTSLVAQGTVTAKYVHTGGRMAIEASTQSNEMDPIQRVEALTTPVAIIDQGGSAFPVDDGVVITSLIGKGADCHFAEIADWWNWVPESLVAQRRSHVGLLDKTAVFAYPTLNMSGKTTSPEFSLLLRPRPGHAWYEHPDFLTGPLRYNPERGVAIELSYQYNDLLTVGCENFAVESCQIKSKDQAWSGGCLVRVAAYNSPLRMNFIDTGVIAGRWSVGVKTMGDGHYGNIVWIPGSPEFAVHHDTQGGFWENNTIVGASDGGAATDTIALTSSRGTHRNNAFFGFAENFRSYYGTAVDFLNCATDKAENMAFAVSTGKKENNLYGLAATDQFMNTTKLGCDLRVKEGSAFYNAGATPSSWNTRSINGARVKQGVVDIGAWEAPRRLPSKIVISGKATNTTGYTTPIRVTLNQVLVGDETQTVKMSDGAQGVFTPATFILSAAQPFQDVVYASAGDLGARTITAMDHMGTYDIADGTFAMQVIAPSPATKLVVENVVAGKVGEAVTFTLSTDNPLFSDHSIVYTLSSDGPGVFAEKTGTLNKGNLNDVISFMPLDSGDYNITISPNGNLAMATMVVKVTVAALPPTYGPGENRYYVGPGRQFLTMDACIAYINNRDLVTDKASIFVHVAGNISVKGQISLTQDSTYFVTILPSGSKGYRTKATMGKFHYPDDGAEMTFAGGDFKVPPGTVVKEMRLKFSDGSRLNFTGLRTGSVMSYLRDNRIFVERLGTDWVIGCGEFASSLEIFNNVFVATRPGVVAGLGDGYGAIYGNTFVGLGAAVGDVTLAFGYYGNPGGQQVIQNNVFLDCGGWPMNFANTAPNRYNPDFFTNNYTNTPLSGAKDLVLPIGMLAHTTSALVVDKALDLRPAENSMLLGKATAIAISKNDGAGNNRGFQPDIGAFQRTPATTLPIVTATKQDLQGQMLKLGVSLVNTVDTLNVIVEADGSGGASRGPLPVTFTATDAAIDISSLTPGKYKAPVFTAANAGGSGKSTGFLPFTIDPIVVNATLADFIGVTDTVLAQGRPKLPFRGTTNGSVVDLLPPTVKLSANQTNFIEQGFVELTAEVGDDVGVTKVEFYKNDILAMVREAAPWTYSLLMSATSTKTSVWKAKAFDLSGKSTTSDAVNVYSNIPSPDLVAPTVVSIVANDKHNLTIEFSRAMNTAPDYDFAGSGSYALGDHMVMSSRWLDGSNTKLSMGLDGHWTMAAGEVLSFSYIQNKIRGWRSADGVLVGSLHDIPVTNNIPVELKEPLHHAVSNIGANLPIASTPWTRGSASWEPNTKLVGKTGGGVVPGAGNPVIAGIARSGEFFNDGYFYQRGLAVFFKMNAATDSAYGLILRSDNSETAFGKGLRVWVTNDGVVHFNHVPESSITPTVLPDIPTSALVAGQEYCLEIQQFLISGFSVYEYRLSASANRVRGATLASVRFHTTESSNSPYMKVYAVNPSATPATITHFEGPTGFFGAPEVWPAMTLPNKARLSKLSNIVESGSAPDYVYTGKGAMLADTPGGVFDLMFSNRAWASNGIQATLGDQINDIHLAVCMSKTANVVGELLPVKNTLMAIRASAVGKKYEVLVNNKLRAAQKQVTIAAGDMIRIRCVATAIFAEVMKNGVWIKLGYIRSATNPDGSNSMMYSQLLLPGNSTVSGLKY